MKTFNLEQGSKEWHDFRDRYDTASEAPVMMGDGYIKRDKFIKNNALGIEDEPNAFLMNLFQKGHDAEELARPIAEEMFGLEFWPLTGAHDDGALSASFDGITEDHDIVWEHKLWNEKLAANVEEKKLPAKYYWQLEQQIYVSGAEKAIFMVSDGTEENMVYMEYKPVRGRVKKLLAGWAQYHKDLDAFIADHPEAQKEDEPVTELAPLVVVASLPSIKFEMNGMALTSNLTAYKEAALILVEDSRLVIQTDEDFAKCEQFNKQLTKAEAYIKRVRSDVLGEVASIDEFTKSLDELNALVREARLNGEKQVKNRKADIKLEIIRDAQSKLSERTREISKTLGGFSLPTINADFGAQMKGKKTIDSLKSAANDYLAELTAENNQIADLIRGNAATYNSLSAGFEFLFPDLQELIFNESDTFSQLIEGRINKQKVDQEEKRKQQAEAEEEERKQLEALSQQQGVVDETHLQLTPDEPETSVILENAPNHVSDIIANNPDLVSPEFVNQGVVDAGLDSDLLEETAPIATEMTQDEIRKHRHNVHTAIKATLVAYGAPDQLATELTKLMSKGQIPRVKIMYEG